MSMTIIESFVTLLNIDIIINSPANMLTCQPVDLSTCRPVDLSTCRHVNLSICRLYYLFYAEFFVLNKIGNHYCLLSLFLLFFIYFFFWLHVNSGKANYGIFVYYYYFIYFFAVIVYFMITREIRLLNSFRWDYFLLILDLTQCIFNYLKISSNI